MDQYHDRHLHIHIHHFHQPQYNHNVTQVFMALLHSSALVVSLYSSLFLSYLISSSILVCLHSFHLPSILQAVPIQTSYLISPSTVLRLFYCLSSCLDSYSSTLSISMCCVRRHAPSHFSCQLISAETASIYNYFLIMLLFFPIFFTYISYIQRLHSKYGIMQKQILMLLVIWRRRGNDPSFYSLVL